MSSEILHTLREGIIFYIILVCSICIHEWAHAFTADKLGDPLPRLQGRVTLNPLAHIDPVGTVFIPLFIILMPIFLGAGPMFALIGWGRPVMLSLPNPETRRRDDMLITAAGPLSNLVLCLLLAIAGGLIGLKFGTFNQLFVTAILINAALFSFNLIPIPPLDGSHFLKGILNLSEMTFYNLSRYSFIILLILINIPQFRMLLSTLIRWVAGFFAMIMLYIQHYLA